MGCGRGVVPDRRVSGRMRSSPIVPRHLVGHVDSAATPSLDPARLGSVVATADGPLRAWGWATLRIRYTVGHHGLDDRGGLKIVLRFPYDGGEWQVDDPVAPNFVRVTASRPCGLRAEYKAFGDARPWFRVFRLQVVGGCLGVFVVALCMAAARGERDDG